MEREEQAVKGVAKTVVTTPCSGYYFQILHQRQAVTEAPVSQSCNRNYQARLPVFLRTAIDLGSRPAVSKRHNHTPAFRLPRRLTFS